MSIYEAIGVGYTIVATTVFTAGLIYFGMKGLTQVQRLVDRGQSEESMDLQRSESIKRELARVE